MVLRHTSFPSGTWFPRAQNEWGERKCLFDAICIVLGHWLMQRSRGYPNFASKRARKHKIPWGPAQDEALAKLIHCLTSPPILILPSWVRAFNLHTDASELGAGAALTQTPEGAERVVAYASHRWWRSDSKRSPTEREVMAVLWAVEHFRPYLWGRRFTLITDCSVLT